MPVLGLLGVTAAYLTLSLGALIHGYGVCPTPLWVYIFSVVSGFFAWMTSTPAQRLAVSRFLYIVALPLFAMGFVSVRKEIGSECILVVEAGVVNLVVNGLVLLMCFP